MITSDVWRVFKWIRRADEHGLLPVAGGGLDQTQSFLDAWDFISNEVRYWEAKLGLDKRG